jgi:hypothetical protein
MRHLSVFVEAGSKLARSAGFDVALSPRRGSNMPAQGTALGTDSPAFFEALRGRDARNERDCFALSGLWIFFCSPTQGVALGWLIAAPLGRNHKCATPESASEGVKSPVMVVPSLARRASASVLQRLLAFLTLVSMLGSATTAMAQDEDDDPVAVPQAQVANFEVQENQFDSWVFQNLQTVAAARKKLDQMLSLQMDDVDRACQLSEAQRKKLHLAGRGDMVQFFEQVEVVRKKFLLVRKDQQKFNEIWQDISPLQVKFHAGLFGEDSFYQKTLRNMLKGEQLSKFSQVDGERRKFQYRAKVELVVAMLENALPLRDEQRQKLITLIVDETKPPRFFGQQDYYIVMWNVSKIPEKTLKPLFDESEWKILKQQFNQVRGLEQWLKQSGALAKDADADEDAEPTRPAKK